MKVKIKLTDDVSLMKGNWYPVNKRAIFDYSFKSGMKGLSEFPIPFVEINRKELNKKENVAPTLKKDDHFAYFDGYPDGTIKPLEYITREEVAVIFYRLLTDDCKKKYDKLENNNFTDIEKSRWSYKSIIALYNAVIISGYDDGTFKPEKPITRAEFATISSKFDQLSIPTENKFSDISSHWAKKFINSSASKGWINGYADGSFKPDNKIIRCEAMKLINEVLDRRVNKEGLIKGAKNWPDNSSDKWYYEIVLEATNSHEYERESDVKLEKWIRIQNE